MKNVPYFDDELAPESAENTRQWRRVTTEAIKELLEYGDDAYGWCLKHARKDGRDYNATLLGLGRHVLVYMDGVSTMLSQGCVEGCTPLLRSMLEAMLGIAHIVEDKHEERALAYQFARIKRRIKKLRMGDKTHKEGQNIQAELVGDIFTPDLLDKMPSDLGKQADELERRLTTEPQFAPVVLEWNRLKNPHGKKPDRREPEWYTLFGGAASLRMWTKKLKCVSLYLFLYKDMSNEAHAGETLEALCTRHGGLRPLRYPHGFHNIVQLVFLMFINSFEKLTSFYDASLGEQFKKHVLVTLHPNLVKLAGKLRTVFEQFK